VLNLLKAAILVGHYTNEAAFEAQKHIMSLGLISQNMERKWRAISPAALGDDIV
jgi:hypothetical protein